MLTDTAVSADKYVTKKKTRKILKHKERTEGIDLQRIWNVKTQGIQVTTGTTGTVSQSFRKYLNVIQGTTENSHIGQAGKKHPILM